MNVKLVSSFIPDFSPSLSDAESDDEDTIAREEEMINFEEQSEEIRLLQQESEMSYEDLIDTLPPEMLTTRLPSKVQDIFRFMWIKQLQ